MERQRKKEKKLVAMAWLLYFSVPFLAWALGWAQWEFGPRAFADFSILKMGLLGASFFGFVHIGLVLPLKKWVWLEKTTLTPFQLIAFSTTVLSLPLVSFAYWVGDVRTVTQAQEISITIIPAVLFSVLIYKKNRSFIQWSVSLSLMVFFYVFLVNEILGPFKTYVYLLSHDNRYEYLRALVPACSLALYYRLQYEPKGSSLSGINSIHHAWKSRSFAKVFKAADPRKSSLETQAKS